MCFVLTICHSPCESLSNVYVCMYILCVGVPKITVGDYVNILGIIIISRTAHFKSR